MVRKALVVGINNYSRLDNLQGCVNDAKRVAQMLFRNGNGDKNFDVKLLTSDIGEDCITNRQIKMEIINLFTTPCEVALFYFAGHGYANENGGFLMTSECFEGEDGVNLSNISNLIQKSHAMNNIVVLDCCQAGSMGKSFVLGDNSVVPSGATYLLACKENQYSQENNGNGVFTDLFVDALSGGAANLVGEISPGNIYSYIDKALSLWEQRPVFKTNIERFVSIRNVRPPIELEDLRKINTLFPTVNYEFPLDPSYEPTSDNYIKENSEIFYLLQKYNRLNLLVPVGAEHMYYAAMESKSCKLTSLGSHYWRLVKNQRI